MNYYFCKGCNQIVGRDSNASTLSSFCETKKRIITLVKVKTNNLPVQPKASAKTVLNTFKVYWKNSSNQNIDDAIKNFLRTKKGKQLL